MVPAPDDSASPDVRTFLRAHRTEVAIHNGLVPQERARFLRGMLSTWWSRELTATDEKTTTARVRNRCLGTG